jgi:hypothetical protein
MITVWLLIPSCTPSKGPGVPCPPTTDYHFDATIEVDIRPNGWHYFYTSHVDRPEPLFYQVYTNNTVQVYVQYKTQCPDGSVPPLAVVPARKSTKIPVPVHEHDTVLVNGLYSQDGAHVRLKLLGQHTAKPISPMTKSIVTFVVMVTATGLYFVKCVLPPLKPKVE